MATVSDIPPNIVLLTAPQLLGMMFNWGLFGVLTVQVYIYYLFFKDPIGTRVLVYSLYFLECVQIALSSADIIYWFAKGWGQLNYLSNPHFAPIDMPMIAGLVAMIVQLYFTWRIWILGRSILLCLVIGGVSVAQGVAGFVSGAQALQVGNLTKLSSLLAPKLWLAGAALSDTMIAFAMCYFLIRAKQRSRVAHTRYLLRRIIALTIETNTLTATVAILTLIFFVIYSTNTLYLCPPYALGKLYSNTLLVIFNNRIKLPRDANAEESYGLKIMTSTFHNRRNNSDNSPAPCRADDGVTVTVMRETDEEAADVNLETQHDMNATPERTSVDIVPQ